MKNYRYSIVEKSYGDVDWTRRTNDPKRALKLLNQGVYGESGLMYSAYYFGERSRTLYIDGVEATPEQLHRLEMMTNN